MKPKEPIKQYYKVNLNEPGMMELYERFKTWKGIPRWCPCSDDERREFEDYILKSKEKGKPNNEM